MNDSAITQEFLSYLKFEKHFSLHTAKCYGADLQQFSDFLIGDAGSGPQGESADQANPWSDSSGVATATQTQTTVQLDQLLTGADINTVRKYLAHLGQHQYSKSTTARKLATLRSFYKFLVKRNYVTDNPVANVKTPKQEKKLPK
ncbi:MAG: site-specific integrase, partial [Planctomycetes bacterium]|nr:site-specific integrase [Planctomycetota bacterium]